MYTFTKIPIKNKASLEEGTYQGILLDIEDTMSRGGDRMFKLTWDVSGNTIYDYIIPEHPNKVCREIAHNKMSTMAEFMLGTADNTQVDLRDCINKHVGVVIKHKESDDGNTYARIVALKKPSQERITLQGKVGVSDKDGYINDRCPF